MCYLINDCVHYEIYSLSNAVCLALFHVHTCVSAAKPDVDLSAQTNQKVPLCHRNPHVKSH